MKSRLPRLVVPLVVAGALVVGLAQPAAAVPATNVRLYARNPTVTIRSRWGSCEDVRWNLEGSSTAPGMGLQHSEHIATWACGDRVWAEFHLTTAWGFDARVYGDYQLRTWVRPGNTWIQCATVAGNSNVQRRVFTEVMPKQSTGFAVQTATNGIPTAVRCGSAGIADVYLSTFESIELI